MVRHRSVVAVLAGIGLSFWSWRRSGYQFAQGCLELLRLTIIVLCAVLFNQPEWIEEFQPEEVPTIAVLVDLSASMDTRDVIPAATPQSAPITRRRRADGADDRRHLDAAQRPLQRRRGTVVAAGNEQRHKPA